MACDHPRCECMHGPEDCVFQDKNRITASTIMSTEAPRTAAIVTDWIEEIEDRLAEINETLKKSHSDNYDHFSGLEIDSLEERKRILEAILQRLEMQEWNL